MPFRTPVAAVQETSAEGYACGTFVICDDGSVWLSDTAADYNLIWHEKNPIPGSKRHHELNEE